MYPDGRLCISILHPPGEDPISGEKAEVNKKEEHFSILILIYMIDT